MCTLTPFIYFKFLFYQFINVFGLYKSTVKANRIFRQGLLIPYIDDASHFKQTEFLGKDIPVSISHNGCLVLL